MSSQLGMHTDDTTIYSGLNRKSEHFDKVKLTVDLKSDLQSDVK